jgi:hypothetical protein
MNIGIIVVINPTEDIYNCWEDPFDPHDPTCGWGVFLITPVTVSASKNSARVKADVLEAGDLKTRGWAHWQ